MTSEPVLIVGAGIGGLSAAIVLARRGTAVEVFEKESAPGGKMREIDVGGARVDSGPTVLTLRWVFDELLDGGLDGRIRLRRADLLARHAWTCHDRLDLFADRERSADAIGAFAGGVEARAFLAFSAEARRMYETLRDPLLRAQQTGPGGLALRVGLDRLGALAAIRPFDSMWTALGAHFRDPRLRQLFGRYATYCGSSPFAAPATLMLIAHVEQEGVWYVEGGMQRLAEALEGCARELGVVFHYGCEVRDVRVAGGRACGVTLADGAVRQGAAVVLNADTAALAGGAFGQAAARAAAPVTAGDRSLSAVTWSLKASAAGFPLVRHNVFFSSDYAGEFEDLFGACRLPRAPTVYACAQDRGDAPAGDLGAERLLLLVNAPATADGRGLSDIEVNTCQDAMFERLRRCGLEVTPTACIRTTPTEFHRLFPHTGGALYGRATHGWAAAFRRPGAATRLPGLYQAGGGAHPGAGVPMAALSGMTAARRLLADLGSTRRFSRGATSGGIWTRSAPTVNTG
jgi:1-hydroxycarotenoid 3,4-desaturase